MKVQAWLRPPRTIDTDLEGERGAFKNSPITRWLGNPDADYISTAFSCEQPFPAVANTSRYFESLLNGLQRCPLGLGIED